MLQKKRTHVSLYTPWAGCLSLLDELHHEEPLVMIAQWVSPPTELRTRTNGARLSFRGDHLGAPRLSVEDLLAAIADIDSSVECGHGRIFRCPHPESLAIFPGPAWAACCVFRNLHHIEHLLFLYPCETIVRTTVVRSYRLVSSLPPWLVCTRKGPYPMQAKCQLHNETARNLNLTRLVSP